MDLHVYNVFDIVYPAAFDKDDPSGQPDIFQLILTNKENQVKHYNLAMSLTSNTYGDLLTIEEGMITKYDHIPGNEGNPDYLVFAANQQFPPLRNWDIINNGVKIKGSWNDILNNIPDFKDFVMANGYLPSGTYTFTFYLHDLDTGEIFSGSDLMVISNDMQVNLLAPGTEVNSGQSVDLLLPISDNTPTFAWQSAATWYELTIWELDPAVYQVVVIDDLPDPLIVLKDLSQQYYQYDSSLPDLQDDIKSVSDGESYCSNWLDIRHWCVSTSCRKC